MSLWKQWESRGTKVLGTAPVVPDYLAGTTTETRFQAPLFPAWIQPVSLKTSDLSNFLSPFLP